MEKVSAAKARENFADIIGQVSYAKERITVTRRGKAVAAVVPIEDLKLLEALEDRVDLLEYKKAMKEWEKEGKKTIPWETVKKELGL